MKSHRSSIKSAGNDSLSLKGLGSLQGISPAPLKRKEGSKIGSGMKTHRHSAIGGGSSQLKGLSPLKMNSV